MFMDVIGKCAFNKTNGYQLRMLSNAIQDTQLFK